MKPFIYYNRAAAGEPSPPPESMFVSATANEDGDEVTVVLASPQTITNADGWSIETIEGATPGLTYTSGSGSDTFIFAAYPRIGGDSVPLINYNSAIGNVSNLETLTDESIINNSVKPIPPIEYEVPEIAATLAGLETGATVINVTSAAELTSLTTGGTVDGTTLAAAAALGPVVIKLTATTYLGSFTFPALSNSDWIYVVGENFDSLPSAGIRTQESDRANMPLFMAADNGGSYNFHFATLHMAFGSTKYRFIGLAATYPLDADMGLGIFAAGKGQANFLDGFVTDADIPRDVIIDRCEIYGRDGAGYLDRKGVNFDVIGGAIIDSRIVDVAGNSSDDPMGIMVTFGGGLLLFQNLEVTASGENIIFGGTDGFYDVHDNIVIRRCWLWKPRHWFSADPSFDGHNRTIKNLLEFKKASKALVEDCVFEDVGETDSGQRLTAIVCTVRNQSGSDLNAVVEHVEVKNCLVRRVGAMVTIIGEDNNFDSLETNHLWFHDILYYDQNYYTRYGLSSYSAIQLSQLYNGRTYKNLHFDHLTVVWGPSGTGTQFASFLGITVSDSGTSNVIPGLVIKNNIFDGYPNLSPREAITTTYPGNGWAANIGIPLLSSGVYECTNNLAFGEDSTERARYPSGNFFEPTYATAGFANYAGATGAIDFKLISGNYRGGQASGATDGTDLGANIDNIEAMVANVISGITTPLTIQSATIGTDGESVTVAFSRNVNLTNSSGWSVEFDNNAARTLSYSSGNGTTGITFTLEPMPASIDGRAPIATNCLLSYDSSIGSVSNLSSVSGSGVINNSIVIPHPDLPQNLSTVAALPSNWSGVADYTPADRTALQNIVNTWAPGSGKVIELTAGVDYEGGIIFPITFKATGDTPIVIRSSAYASLPTFSLTGASHIAKTGYEVHMATISRQPTQATHYVAEIRPDTSSGGPGVSNVRFIGIKFIADGSGYTNNNYLGVVSFISGTTHAPKECYPRGIVFDRCAFTCGDSVNVHDTIVMRANNSAIVGCNFYNLWGGGNDGSNAIRAYAGSGLLIQNNYMECMGAACFLGDGNSMNVDVWDCAYNLNYHHHPTGWDDGLHGSDKSNYETKVGHRILVSGNIFQNQSLNSYNQGHAVMSFKGEKNTTDHLTVIGNKVTGAYTAFVPLCAASAGDAVSGPNNDMLFTDNLCQVINRASRWTVSNTSGIGFSRVQMVKNTFYGGNCLHYMYDFGTGGNHFIFRDNIHESGGGMVTDGTTEGALTINNVWNSTYVITHNIFVGKNINFYDNDTTPVPSGILSGNYFPALATGIFTNPSAGDYSVNVSSVYNTGSSTGGKLGYDSATYDALWTTVV